MQVLALQRENRFQLDRRVSDTSSRVTGEPNYSSKPMLRRILQFEFGARRLVATAR